MSAAGFPMCQGDEGPLSEKATEGCGIQRIWFLPPWLLAHQSWERREGTRRLSASWARQARCRGETGSAVGRSGLISRAGGAGACIQPSRPTEAPSLHRARAGAGETQPWRRVQSWRGAGSHGGPHEALAPSWGRWCHPGKVGDTWVTLSGRGG